ncbi:RNA methyltransferase [Acetobacterium sp.]|uniref:TrmH family RNA methyltransferase n=1 Tax=Acetobacterium sp. TaxID=1872094 RepID=UPI002722FC95|nr:RNA methyltransferase [Acetobacterium sp.]MDO9493818.1 RNA methyltransferase [Acetobacterium sp.]
MFQEITSKNNDQLKYLRKLSSKSFRDSEGTFAIEGTKLFLEAVKNELRIKQIFITKDWLEINAGSNSDYLIALSENDVTVTIVNSSILSSISSLQKPEGIICVLSKISVPSGTFKRYVLLEDVQDPYNVGTIIRTADAAGFDCIVTSTKTADVYNEKVLRGSMGSVFHLPIYQVESLLDYVKQLKSQPITLIGTSLTGGSLWERKPLNGSFAIVMGNESQGMSHEMSECCDLLLKIPILGRAESLNVATAAGIIMYDLVRDFK